MKRKIAYIDAFWHERSCTVVKNDDRHNELSRETMGKNKARNYLSAVNRASKPKVPVFNHERVFSKL